MTSNQHDTHRKRSTDDTADGGRTTHHDGRTTIGDGQPTQDDPRPTNDGGRTAPDDGRTTNDDGRTAHDGGRTAHDGDDDPESRRSFTRRTVVRAGAVGVGALALGGVPTVTAASVERESCEEWDTFELGDGHWHLVNNQWGMPDSEQCIRELTDGRYGYHFAAEGEGINYPEVFCGGRPWGSETGVPELPTRRGDIDELVLEWDVDVDIDGGEWNLAEEWWLLDGAPAPENPPITHEIMLVLDWGPGHGHYMEEEGILTDRFGNRIDHWADYDHSGGWSFQIFRIAGGASSGRVDLAEISDFLTREYDVSEDLTFTGVEVGTEYWAGSEGEVTYDSLDLTVDGTTYESGVDGGSVPDPEPDPDPDVIEVGEYEARDTTGDGRYNDVTGDGETTHDDVVAFFEHLEDDAVQDNVDAFDFADDGRVGFSDVIALFRQV